MRSVELLNALGNLDIKNGKADDAVTYFKKALLIARSSHDELGVGGSLLGLGDAQYSQNDIAKAEALYNEAREIYHCRKALSGIACTDLKLGKLHSRQSKFFEAKESYTKAKETYTLIANQAGVANAVAGIGEVQLLQKYYAESETSYSEAQIL